jgi:hypothetical protein
MIYLSMNIKIEKDTEKPANGSTNSILTQNAGK